MTWKNDESVKKWFAEISQRTRENCTRPFELWLGFIDVSPDEQIKKRILDLQSPNPQTRRYFEDKLIQWKNSLESETEDGKRKYASTTVKSKLQRVMGFFAHNNLRLMFGRGQLNVEPSQRERVSLKWILGKTEVRLMYKRASLDEKARLLCLYQSGFSPIDLCELKIEDFPELYTTERHHYVCKRRQKTNVWQQTCLSVECIHDLKLLLEKRGNPKSGLLFTTQRGKPLTQRFLNESIKGLALRTFGREKSKQFKTKNLRDGFKNGLLRAKISTEIIDSMFGHLRSGAKGAYELSQQLIEESYEQLFGYLSVNGGLQSKADYQALKTTQIELAETITELQKQLKEMSSEISELKTMIGITSIEAVHKQVKALQKAKSKT